MLPPRLIRRLVLAPLVIVLTAGFIVLSPFLAVLALVPGLLAARHPAAAAPGTAGPGRTGGGRPGDPVQPAVAPLPGDETAGPFGD